MKVSMAIAVRDKDGIRSKTGDIICVRPAGWEWGKEEVKQFLIVEVDLGNAITDINDARKLEVPQLDNGALVMEFKGDNPDLWPKIIGKRRYNLPFTDLIAVAQTKGVTIDLAKLQDPKEVYQPIEKTTLSFSGLIKDKILNQKIAVKDLNNIKGAGK